MVRLVIGSEHHKEVFCREFLATHIPYDVTTLRWPRLDATSRARLQALPFWSEAVSTERATAAKVQTQAERETDPLIRQAIALQGFEEARHSQLLETLLRTYDIAPESISSPPVPVDVEWAFLRTEYGECFDSFFAFGLFAIAKESGLFPSALVELFEPIVQEEARHILFFVNWVAYQQAQLAWWKRPAQLGRRACALTIQAWSRVQTARGMGEGDNFTMTGHEALDIDISPRTFLDICLRENERRLGLYDRRLLRPRIVPTLAKTLSCVLRVLR